MHGLEVPAMGLVDGAVTALLGAEPLQRTGADGDADVGGDDRGSASAVLGSFLHPAVCLRRLGGQHPVEQHAIGDCPTEAA
jgi:hypothetical protein